MGLGMPPKEHVEIEDAARAVIQSLALLQQHATLSPQNLNLIAYEWEPNSRDEILSGIPDLLLPAWVERQWSNNQNPDQDFWQDVRVCNLAELESYRLRGDWNKCSFYIDGQEQLHIKFSYAPQDYTYRTHRIWYSPDVQLAEAFNDQALSVGQGIPANFFPLVSGMAEMELIPTYKLRLAMEDEPSKAMFEALNDRFEYLSNKVGVWQDRFHHHIYGERGNRKGGRRKTILPRGMRI